MVSGSRAVAHKAKNSNKQLRKFILRSSIILALLIANFIVLAQTNAGGTIQGIVGSGTYPLPGVEVTATGADGKKTVTTTGVNGQYQLKVPATGHYTIDVELAAFAPAKKEVDVSDLAQPVRMDFDIPLRSRAPQEQQAAAPAPPPATVPLAARGGRGNRGGQQNPTLLQTARNQNQDANAQQDDDLTATPPDFQAGGAAADAPTESVAVLGNTATNPFGGNQNFDRDQIRDLIDQQFGGPPGGPGGNDQGGGGGGRGGRGGPGGGNFQGGGGGGRGGRGGGGGGGGRGFAFGRGGRGFGATTPRGSVSYQLADSFFNAAPYSVTGAAVPVAPYSQNNFTASLGGPMVIPHIVKNTNTSYTVTFTGVRNSTSQQALWIVPTMAERNGDFSQTVTQKGANTTTPVQIFNPATGAAFANNQIDPSLFDQTAVNLLPYIPLPNYSVAGSPQNLLQNYNNTSSSNNLNVRFNHTFGAQQQQQQGRGGGGNRGGGGGGRNGGRRGTNLNFGFQISDNTNITNSPIPTVRGDGITNGLNATLGFVRPFGRINSSTNFNLNRQHTQTTNGWAGRQNIESALGILGTSTDSFDWGLPSLSFTNFQGLQDIAGSTRLNQTEQISEDLLWNRGKHNVRFGGAFRMQQQDNHSTANSRGTFTFTGARTAEIVACGTQGTATCANAVPGTATCTTLVPGTQTCGAPVTGTGYDFADFLLGLPQQTTQQGGPLTFYFRGRSWNAYVQDDWRALSKLTVQAGLRYDYNSPYYEAYNHIANLDLAPDYSNAVAVLPGQAGPYHGSYSRSLIKPDHTQFSPRLGLAYRVTNGTVMRLGYGITFNGSAYAGIAGNMSNQPPFSIAQKWTYAPVGDLANGLLPVTLSNGFATPIGVSNTYGIDPNYRLGYAQQWDFSVQQEVRPLRVQVLVDYTGTKGTHLDLLETPNLAPTGQLRIVNVQDFKWETFGGDSILQSGLVRVNRRLANGISFGVTYQFSKSIDDASTLSGGGGGGTAIQNLFDRRADRGISTIDQPHRLNVQYNYELPFGTNKHFFSEPSLYKAALGDWQLNGTWAFTSGTPLTVNAPSSCYTNLTGVTNGTLRANATGFSTGVSDKSVAEWFNTSAFTCPIPGQYGNAGKDTLRNPGVISMAATLNKTFQFADGRSLNVRIQASNPLNMVQYNRINTTLNSPTFGRVTNAANMRTAQVFARFNF